MQDKKIGLALGGGGARGLAHIPVLETIDKMELSISQLSGTSIGAIIGSFYACGLKGKEIRKILDTILAEDEEFWSRFFEKRSSLKWYELLAPQTTGPGLINVDKFLDFLKEHLPVH